ncbi:hypothetical protein [Arthrobacter sp. SLBN-112]|uniref:hypothetical protein n=1 Tax=Arthrobacter sp. SLBN-112 TaxID=2768452 RepID=UPI0027B7516D|nr:hypothetical protein [Arthrobacter sp. SLBN-112]MDQ0800025.1 hypothetical protein [Arthrobacter sp. SLBN-112]
MQRSSVDLPEPLGPMMQQISPLAISRLMFLRTFLAPKDFSMPRARTVPSQATVPPSANAGLVVIARFLPER